MKESKWWNVVFRCQSMSKMIFFTCKTSCLHYYALNPLKVLTRARGRVCVLFFLSDLSGGNLGEGQDPKGQWCQVSSAKTGLPNLSALSPTLVHKRSQMLHFVIVQCSILSWSSVGSVICHVICWLTADTVQINSEEKEWWWKMMKNMQSEARPDVLATSRKRSLRWALSCSSSECYKCDKAYSKSCRFLLQTWL